jgi:hypothetical protein
MRTLIAAIGVVATAACSVVGVRDTPEPEYDVVERLGEDVEIRRYAPRVAAEARMGAGGSRNAAFGLLFDYISGANRPAEKIAMTAPVATDEAEGAEIAMTAPVAEDRRDGYAMRFFLPRRYDSAAAAPQPTDSRVRLVEAPEQIIATLRFSGSRGAEHVAERRAALLRALEGSGWRPAGPAESWFYDPPWTLPPARRNEIAIPVERAAAG